jgi:cystathionine beta-lyase/cystathionine gamma-synthase
MPGSGGYRDRSVLIHGKFRSEKWDFQDHILPPITTATSFRLRSAERGAEAFAQFANPDIDRNTASPIYIYERLDEPCSGLLEESLAFAEKGECAVAYATGMAAIAAAIGIHVTAGTELIHHPAIYGCTHSHLHRWMTRFGVESKAVNLRDSEELAAAINAKTRVIFFETPSNPTMELVDIAAVVEAVKAANEGRCDEEKIRVVVDNTFASPFGQRPLEMGVDFVVHSLTKHIGGFGATMGGVVIGPRSAETDLLLYRKDFGATLSPDAAWHILTYGLPTLSIRMERQQESAQKIAEFLASDPNIERVVYPGLPTFADRELAAKQMTDIDGDLAPGAMIYFNMAGDDQAAYSQAVKVINHIADGALSITLAVSLGQIRTLIEHPSSMTHAALSPEDQKLAGIDPGGIRLSIGLEDHRDLIKDLHSALESLK